LENGQGGGKRARETASPRDPTLVLWGLAGKADLPRFVGVT
jgi:hypothetical protein